MLKEENIKNSSSRITESDLEEDKHNDRLDQNDPHYLEFHEESDYYSDFWMLNKNGFIGEHQAKEGFLLGPSIFKKMDRSNPEEMKWYEIYAPTVFVKTSVDENRTFHKLVVFVFQEMMFVYLLDDEKLEEHEYTILYEKSKSTAENLVQKINPIINSSYEAYLRNDSRVRFYYFNETNLAVKYSPSVTIDILSSELRHFFNVIKRKFDSNESLEEYKITANSLWIIGVKSLSRLVIILLPVSLSQEKMELEKKRILKKYFTQFIF